VVDEVERATRAVEKQVGYLDDIAKWSETIASSNAKVRDRVERMTKDFAREIERLDEQVAALKTAGADA
jgi:hypothetical protein